MAEAVKVGVVGLGYFGAHHARHYAANPAAHLVAVADADYARACAAGETYVAEPHADHRELIGKVDAVSVAVPTSIHHAVAGDFLDAGIPVFVEKPIAADVDAAADLVGRAKRAGVALQVGHIERFSPAFQALAAEVEAPVLIQAIRQGPFKPRAIDVDVVLDLMIHDIDLVLTLARAPVVSVAASGVKVATDTVDIAEARLTFETGLVATLVASRVAPTVDRRLTVTESRRQFVADLGARQLTVTSHSDVDGVHSKTREFEQADNLAAEIAGFLDSVASGTAPQVDGQAGLDALNVADMIRKTMATGQYFRPFDPKRSFHSMTSARTGAALAVAETGRIGLYDLQRQRMRLEPGLRGRIEAVLAHGQFILGPEVDLVEKQLASFAGVPHAIAVSSGRDALMIALMAMGVKAGDAVFVPSFTFAATAGAVVSVGATPVFVDVDPETFNMDAGDLDRALDEVKAAGEARAARRHAGRPVRPAGGLRRHQRGVRAQRPGDPRRRRPEFWRQAWQQARWRARPDLGDELLPDQAARLLWRWRCDPHG